MFAMFIPSLPERSEVIKLARIICPSYLPDSAFIPHLDIVPMHSNRLIDPPVEGRSINVTHTRNARSSALCGHVAYQSLCASANSCIAASNHSEKRDSSAQPHMGPGGTYLVTGPATASLPLHLGTTRSSRLPRDPATNKTLQSGSRFSFQISSSTHGDQMEH
jgi:hypothetical protein